MNRTVKIPQETIKSIDLVLDSIDIALGVNIRTSEALTRLLQKFQISSKKLAPMTHKNDKGEPYIPTVYVLSKGHLNTYIEVDGILDDLNSNYKAEMLTPYILALETEFGLIQVCEVCKNPENNEETGRLYDFRGTRQCHGCLSGEKNALQATINEINLLERTIVETNT